MTNSNGNLFLFRGTTRRPFPSEPRLQGDPLSPRSPSPHPSSFQSSPNEDRNSEEEDEMHGENLTDPNRYNQPPTPPTDDEDEEEIPVTLFVWYFLGGILFFLLCLFLVIILIINQLCSFSL